MGQSTLISILLFNRKRPGELSRMKRFPYENCKESLRESQPNYYNQLPKKSKEIADEYVRVLLRGKRNVKITPVLLDTGMVKCINLFLQHRSLAGVNEENLYVFGLPDGADGFKWIEASPLLNKYSKDCGASVPHLLRGTTLRKHIATVGIALNLTDGEVENLSKFMGHEKDIHLRIYRQPVGAKDILEVSQYLQKAQNEFLETPQGRAEFTDGSLSDMEENTDTEEDELEENDIFAHRKVDKLMTKELITLPLCQPLPQREESRKSIKPYEGE